MTQRHSSSCERHKQGRANCQAITVFQSCHRCGQIVLCVAEAILTSHPIGATGARLVVTLIHALKARGAQRGVAALCIGGGEATALAIELSA
ncbi:hypothetical protein AB1K42_19795 [Roseibium algicola]|uniref:hypothetical protein n=1 Tax=Roseibium algicola TaxID=2857014 RepID=UPI003458E98E